MPVPALVAAVALGAPMTDDPTKPLSFPPPPSRFAHRQPLPGVPGVLFDTRGYGANLAGEIAAKEGLQGRVMWVDATANVDRYNTEQKIVELVDKLKGVGFNTVVLDVKPISGHVIYPSRIAPKLTEWRGKTLPLEFDPVAVFVRECKRTGLSLLFSLNAFSEGHQLMKTGPGYERPEWQSILYDPTPVLDLGGQRYPLAEPANAQDADPARIVWANRAEALPPLAPDVAIATVDWPRGAVVALADGATATAAPKIPNRGYVLIGRGPGAEFLRANARVGLKVRLDTQPEYVRMEQRPESQVPLMVNPNHPEVRGRALAVMEEVAANYDADGFLYDDRFRYAGINGDFSPYTMALFENHLGRRLNWPDDVFKFTVTPTFGRGIAPGPFYDAWMAWRALQLRNYFADVRATVQRVRPRALVGLYVGSWYGEYPAYGANVASPELDAGFWFLTPEYQLTGIAPLLDVLMTGAYYPTPTMYDGIANGAGIGNTIEGAGQLTVRIARDQCWSYSGIMLSQFKDDPDRLIAALQAACGSTQGVMVFDLSHDSEPLMPTFARAFADPRGAPHTDPKALASVRRRRAEWDKKHREEPVTIGLGSAGTGL